MTSITLPGPSAVNSARAVKQAVGRHTARDQRFGMEIRTRAPTDPLGVGCPSSECPWYSRDRDKAGTGYRTKDETMRAVGLFTHGGPEVLQVVELPEVHAGPGQVRIRVHAATVNPTDVGVRNGTRAEQQKTDPPPYVPGMEAAGIVDEVGSGVPDRLKLGDARKDPSRGRHLADERADGAPVARPAQAVQGSGHRGDRRGARLWRLRHSTRQSRGADGHRRRFRKRRKAGCVAWRRHRRSAGR